MWIDLLETKEIELVILKLPTKEIPVLNGFHWWIIPNMQRIIPTPHSFFQKEEGGEEEGLFPLILQEQLLTWY